MPYLQPAQGPTLYYEEKGTGRPLVLVHDWGGSLRVWDSVVGELATRFRVIGLDFRGHGHSEVANSIHNIDAFAEDIASLADGLGLSDVVLVGWSMGGQACLRYVSRGATRVSKLALVGTMPFYLDISPYQTNWTQEFIREIGEMAALARPLFLRRFFALYFGAEPDSALIDWLASIALDAPAWVTAECSASLFATDLRPVLPTIGVSTLVMHGRRDRMCAFDAARLLSEQMPNARLAELEAAGHSPHIEDRAAFMEALLGFAAEP